MGYIHPGLNPANNISVALQKNMLHYARSEQRERDDVATRLDDHGEIIPVLEEQAVVRKRKRITGAVRVRTVVREDERVVDEPLAVETVEVERVSLGRWVESAPAVRQEEVPLLTPEGRDQESHLLYVAATRARRGPEPNGAVWG